MPDRKEIIKGLLQHCEGSIFVDRCGECPYYDVVTDDPFQCRDGLLMDALVLLKEQEPVRPIKKLGIVESFKCGACEWVLGWAAGFPLYCPRCGRKVDWNA